MMVQPEDMTALYFDGVTAAACDVKFNITTTDGQRNDNVWEDSGRDDIILMQFTGLKDKNGKEIYEGDVLRDDASGNYPRNLWEVAWDADEAKFYLEQLYEGKRSGSSTRYLDINGKSVFGNIYENPELLTK